MSGSSYAVRKDTLTPTAAIIATVIAGTPEKSIGYIKLEQILFLADWKCCQATGRPRIDCAWMHDNQTVTAAGLFQKLQQDNHFVLTNPNAQRSARVALARQFDFTLDADVQQAIGAYLKFLDGQGPSALKQMCSNSYPVRSTQPGRRFQLDERVLAYNKSRRQPA